MKLLLCSDLHADRAATTALVSRMWSYDVLIVAGDFGNSQRHLDVCIDILFGCRKPIVAVSGNNDTTDALRAITAAESNWHILHGNGVCIDGVNFYGVGGGIPVTPYGSWSYDFDEAQATALLADCPTGAVLVTHSPPKHAVDRASSGVHLGSTAIRRCIEERSPILNVCGHIHASAGQREMIGSTTIINAGPAGIAFDIEVK